MSSTGRTFVAVKMWKPLSKAEKREEKKRKEEEEKKRKKQEAEAEKKEREKREEEAEEEEREKKELMKEPSWRAARLLIAAAKEIKRRKINGTFEILGKPGNNRIGVLVGSLYNYTAHFESRPGRASLEIKCARGCWPEMPAGYFSLAIPIKPDKIKNVAQRLENYEVTSIEIKRFIKQLGLKL